MAVRALCCVTVLSAALAVGAAQGVSGGGVAISLGGRCTASNDCNSIGSATCKDGICVCLDTDVPHTDNSRCLLISTEFGSACEIGPQCTSKWKDLAACTAGICTCQSGHAFDGKVCLPIVATIDDSCDSSNNICYLSTDGNDQHVSCVGNKCKCNSGYEATDDKKSCKKSNSGALHLLSISTLMFVVMAKILA